MKKIGVLSDTHGYTHPSLFEFFKDCDEIWHAGDLGNSEVLIDLQSITKTRAVWGNCDDWGIRSETSEHLVFECEQHKVAMMHIAGRPGRFEKQALEIIEREKPTLFVAGHSHILCVKNDPEHHLLFINPGAAGRYGIHTRLTFLRFDIDGKNICNLEVYDEPKVQPIK